MGWAGSGGGCEDAGGTAGGSAACIPLHRQRAGRPSGRAPRRCPLPHRAHGAIRRGRPGPRTALPAALRPFCHLGPLLPVRYLLFLAHVCGQSLATSQVKCYLLGTSGTFSAMSVCSVIAIDLCCMTGWENNAIKVLELEISTNSTGMQL